MQSAGLILVASNADLEQQDRQRYQDQVDAERRRESSVESSLAGYVRKRWELAKRYKEPHELRMLNSLRQIEGRYSDTKANEIKSQGLPLIYMRITSVKCRAAKSWIRDVLMPAGDKPWSLNPTPISSLPPDMQHQIQQRVLNDAMQYMAATGEQITPDAMREMATQVATKVREHMYEQATVKINRMVDTIDDQLMEGGWTQEFDNVISDIVDFPAGILKGPVIHRRKKLAWGGTDVEVKETFAPEVERVDPFNFYPLPGVVNPNDGDCIEYHEYSRDDIHDLIGVPGYNEEAIRDVLRDCADGQLDYQRTSLRSQQMSARGELSVSSNEDGRIGSIEFWGSIKGRLLLDWGMTDDEVPDPEAMYDVMVELIGRHVVCVRFNPDPLGSKPYSKACFEDVPGSFWGKGVPDLIEDCQNICNAAARSLVANMGISSGPQVGINVQSIPPGQDITNVYPWKIWQLDYSKTGSSNRPPIEFYQPSPMTDSLLKVYDQFSRLADEYSGIPSYTYGGQQHQGGAARTASGLSMLMNAASKAIKNVIKHIDAGVISPTIERFYVWNMLYTDDDDIKGDAQVVARGALSLVAKEQNQMRLQELLQQTANPLDMQIIGIDGRAAMLRHALQGVDVGGDTIIPDKEELRRIAAQMQAQQAQQATGGLPQ